MDPRCLQHHLEASLFFSFSDCNVQAFSLMYSGVAKMHVRASEQLRLCAKREFFLGYIIL